jgi:hypothetical protein
MMGVHASFVLGVLVGMSIVSPVALFFWIMWGKALIDLERLLRVTGKTEQHMKARPK